MLSTDVKLRREWKTWGNVRVGTQLHNRNQNFNVASSCDTGRLIIVYLCGIFQRSNWWKVMRCRHPWDLSVHGKIVGYTVSRSSDGSPYKSQSFFLFFFFLQYVCLADWRVVQRPSVDSGILKAHMNNLWIFELHWCETRNAIIRIDVAAAFRSHQKYRRHECCSYVVYD